jgi:hypothetical protein
MPSVCASSQLSGKDAGRIAAALGARCFRRSIERWRAARTSCLSSPSRTACEHAVGDIGKHAVAAARRVSTTLCLRRSWRNRRPSAPVTSTSARPAGAGLRCQSRRLTASVGDDKSLRKMCENVPRAQSDQEGGAQRRQSWSSSVSSVSLRSAHRAAIATARRSRPSPAATVVAATDAATPPLGPRRSFAGVAVDTS